MARALFSVAHPAHVHIFKNAAWELQRRGWTVLFVSRQKEMTTALVRHYGFEHRVISVQRSGMLGLSREQLVRVARLLPIMRQFKPDIVVSPLDPSVGAAAWVSRKPYLALADTEHARLTVRLGVPFATRVLTPECFLGDLGEKQIRYKEYHELAYLHPRYFTPNPSVLTGAGLTPGTAFSFVRFVSFRAAHDRGQGGFSYDGRIRLVRGLSECGRVLVSSEEALPPELHRFAFAAPPHLIHHFLYYASVCVSEGATIASECAMLGTPAVYMNTLSAGTLNEQQDVYGLIFAFRGRQDEHGAIDTVLRIVGQSTAQREEWRTKAARLVQEKTDVTAFIVEAIMRA